MHRCILPLAALLILAPTALSAQLTSAAVKPEEPAAAGSPASPPNLTLSHSHVEDWTILSLSKSRLPLTAPNAVLLSKSEIEGGCTRELLRLQWRPNDPIDLYLVRPAGAQKMPVVLFLYNYTADDAVFREDRWCSRVTQNGFAMAGFATALSWPRMRPPRPMKEWFVSELQEALATSAHDVQMMLNYLETRDDLDLRRVGIFGQGSGGAVAILAASVDPRIKALDLIDPWGDWPDWLRLSPQIPGAERAAYLRPDFLARVSTLDPAGYLPQLKGRAIHIQLVSNELVTPTVAKDKMAAAAPDTATVSRYPNAKAEAEALGANGILGWLASEVHAGSSQ